MIFRGYNPIFNYVQKLWHIVLLLFPYIVCGSIYIGLNYWEIAD